MEKFNVLIVDDEERFRMTMTRLLQARGLFVMSAGNGDEALKELAVNPYDVVVLDIKMPGISGIETFKRMKDMGCMAEVVILSGHASVDTAIEIIELGAYDYLMKPCDTEDLIAKISLAYERKLERQRHSR